jgi:hypothetical protein
MKKNVPYVKIYENGVLVNPITQENPYIQGPSQKNRTKQRLTNNKKGESVSVVRIGLLSFIKYNIQKQFIGDKLIVHSVLKN